MSEDFNLSPNVETITDYYLHYAEDKPVQNTVKDLMEAGITRRQAVLALFNKLLSKNMLKDALELGE